ncbi:MAG: NUDIX domain-containing protein [Desulfobacterales bacterium]
MNGLPELPFRFCPACGSSRLNRPESNAVGCMVCGFIFFINMAAAVAAVIRDEKRRILLTRRLKDPAKGLWDLPGGFVNPGESAENALMREIKEELNLEISRAFYMGSTPGTYRFADVDYRVLNLIFACTPKDLNGMRVGDDVAEITFLSPSEIDFEQIGLASIKSVLRLLQH